MKFTSILFNTLLFTTILIGLINESYGDSKIMKLIMLLVIGIMVLRHSENVLLKSFSFIANTGYKSSIFIKNVFVKK